MAEKKRILIVEDEKPLARAMMLKLKDSGFIVKNAYDGIEALEILKKEKFDLILLDLIMPRMDGFGTLDEIKARGITTPVIITSNLSQEEDRQRAKEEGAVGFFIKADVALSSIVDQVKLKLGI